MLSPSSTLWESPAPPKGSPRDRDNRYYQLLAGGAKTRLLEGFIELRVPELLGGAGPLAADEICRRLNLDLTRGWKFLHLLALAGLLTETPGVDKRGAQGTDGTIFGLSEEAIEYFGPRGDEGYFYRDLVHYWRHVAMLPFADVLRGMPLPEAVRWPPESAEAADHLETWMRVTATGAIRTLVNSGAMAHAERLLDVGGGDGTIACALVELYGNLDATVFNLPASARLAEQNIASRGLTERVHVHIGDFLRAELPTGFDRVLFSRVLTDWNPQICLMLFRKAKAALVPGGRLVINEALVEGNVDYTVAWEFRYLFYDTFGRSLLKPLEAYEQLLHAAGFEIVQVTPMIDDAFYSVIEAQPIGELDTRR
ncbi:MAG: methyltransferase domain-containing protein [Planctomycetia bacterium]|nr:methyltransferase domain-containing protein [Planctomycetia bacterium]